MRLKTKRTHGLVLNIAAVTSTFPSFSSSSPSVHRYYSPTPKSKVALVLPFPRPPSPQSTVTPSFPYNTSPSLSYLLRSASINKIAFLRHGNTNPKPSDGTDYDRQLTDLGEKQAINAGISFRSLSLPLYHRVLCSPAPRCVDTARLFLNSCMIVGDGDGGAGEKQKDKLEIVTMPVLYDGTMQPEGSRLFRKIGYAPLRSYLQDDDPIDAGTAQEVLGTYANNAMVEIARVIEKDDSRYSTDNAAEAVIVEDNDRKKDKTLLFVGHAVYLPSVALGVGYDVLKEKEEDVHRLEDILDLVLSTNTKEAEGYILDVVKGEISLLQRPVE
mmetsp:Transcript_15587/g.22377  ORF Transcript_15587/g.22377 Transcript_15587/m.22377 type:complete len:328 (+) Transcript_15587:116-1099(+)